MWCDLHWPDARQGSVAGSFHYSYESSDTKRVEHLLTGCTAVGSIICNSKLMMGFTLMSEVRLYESSDAESVDVTHIPHQYHNTWIGNCHIHSS
jgi:hypothetical protein